MAKLKYKKLSKSKLRNFCDDLWAISVKLRDNNKCVICGATEYINAHHLISRRIYKTRFMLSNGISVCPKCHEYSLSCSFHTAWWGAETWVKENRPEQYQIWLKNREIYADGEETDYEEIYLELEENYKKITGNYLRIERINNYILFTKAEEIKKLFKECKKPIEILENYKTFNITEKNIKDFIKLNQKWFSE